MLISMLISMLVSMLVSMLTSMLTSMLAFWEGWRAEGWRAAAVLLIYSRRTAGADGQEPNTRGR